mgnify:FL=1
MNIVLYQIIPELDPEHLMFNCFSYAKDLCGEFIPAQIYEAVFNDKVEAGVVSNFQKIELEQKIARRYAV